MRRITLAFACLLLAASCGSSTTTPDAPPATPDGPSVPLLTVNNTIAWCAVTVTVGTAAPVTFNSASMAFPAAASTTVMLHAVPHATFMPVVWTGVTTMNGADATYVMTSAAAQTVTACCPRSDGTGC